MNLTVHLDIDDRDAGSLSAALTEAAREYEDRASEMGPLRTAADHVRVNELYARRRLLLKVRNEIHAAEQVSA